MTPTKRQVCPRCKGKGTYLSIGDAHKSSGIVPCECKLNTPKPRKRKSLYPTRLRVGDRIEGDGWSATWDGRRVVGGCGEAWTPTRLRSALQRAIQVPIGTCPTVSCVECDKTCILEQLVAEGAL
jgi:hypothetical protein